MFDVAEHKRGALLNVQVVENDVQAPHRLTRFRVERFHRRLREPVERRRQEDPPDAPPSKLPLEGANRHGEYEASKGVPIAQSAHLGKYLEKDFLRQIVGTAGSPQRPLKEPKDHGGMLVVRGRGGPEFARDEGVRQLRIFRMRLVAPGGEA